MVLPSPYSCSYPAPLSLEEDLSRPSNELQAQAVWFEQLLSSPLKTDDGRSFVIVQPGLWNHGAGPDFTRAAIRWLSPDTPEPGPTDLPDIHVGDVEVHLHAADWFAHRHHEDPAYDNTLLHVVWDEPARSSFPATSDFRRVPQVILSKHLAAPWASLLPVVTSYSQSRSLPESKPGRCQAELTGLSEQAAIELVQSAGLFRLQQRNQRWLWRKRLTSPEQALFEALAEALGYHVNQIPMRLLAQRLPFTFLRTLSPTARMAHVFGLAGFLPAESTRRLSTETRAWLTPLWEIWWKARAAHQHATLPKEQWNLAGLRPLNRPERRLAALVHLVPQIPGLWKNVVTGDMAAFSNRLYEITDPFWDDRATLTSEPFLASQRLIGADRVQNILTNIFWPWVAWDDPTTARLALESVPAPANRNARIATQRVLQGVLPSKWLKTALVQQGLLQIFKDYCQTDCSACNRCTFPEAIQQRSAIN